MAEKDNILYEKALDYAVRVINLYKHLIKGSDNMVIPKQILASGTSIGAQISESRGAQSEADFITKLHLSLKEAQETEYWLILLHRTHGISDKEYNSMNNDLQEIIALLTSSLKTLKNRKT